MQLLIIKIEILRHGHKAQSKLIDTLTMRKFNNSFTPNRTAHDWISSDIESVDNYTSDPLCGFIVTNSLWHDVCICMLNIFKKNFYSSKNFNIPILIISGENDAASSMSKFTKKLYDFLSAIFNNVSLKIVKECRHEVFTELNKHSSYNYLINYIKHL